jgi:hypothetical protein
MCVVLLHITCYSDTVGDLTSLMLTPGSPITNGSFSQVYRRTIGANEDTKEVCLTNPSPRINH